MIYLVRHGQTEENVKHILQGTMQGHLTALGKQQAHEVATKLKHIVFEAILCSDLQRCKDTAKAMLDVLDNSLDVVTTKLLRERDWGSATGMVVDGYTHIDVPDDAESLEAMRKRARIFLDYAQATYKGNILVVSHGMFCRMLQAEHYGKAMKDISLMSNGEIRLLSGEGKRDA